jgi:isochorismate synthase
MNPVNNSTCEIDALIRQNKAFAIYRIPGEIQLRFLAQKSDYVRTFHTIEALNDQNGFVIAPFRISKTCPVVLIESDQEMLVDAPNIRIENPLPETHEQPSDDYQSRFDVFTKYLLNNTFEKLVLSRSLTMNRKAGFSPARVFYKACVRYVHSYVYLFHTPQTGTWLGSTPEVLLAGEKDEWYTVALAGTQPLQNGKLPEIWNNKKREEQQLVTDYVRNRLLAFNIRLEEEGPYTARAGELAHLKTDFRFSLGDKTIGDLLSALHPTPAVCGIPKDEAFRFIVDNEGYDRRYYSGFIGRLCQKSKSDLYVNLRCMQIEDRHLILYAGGGLLTSSDLEEEWRETEDKLQTMLRMII